MAEETFSANLQLSKPDVGGQNNVWGGSLNTDFDFLDDHVAGYISKSVAGAVDVTLTEAEFRHKTLKFTGVLTGSINVIVPAREFAKRMENATTGAFTLTVKTSAGSGAAIVQGKKALLTGDATNVAMFMEEGAAASSTEILTGTNATKFATPDAIAALWEQGSNIASAGTISIDEGGLFHVTGTTTITDIDFATTKAGRGTWLVFDGILTLTHHATNLILPTGADIVTAAGDMAYVVSEGGDIVRVLHYLRASGLPLVADVCIGVACSDEVTALATGTAKATIHAPFAFTLTEVIGELSTAQASGNIFTVDVNEAGTTVLSTKLTIDNTEETSVNPATPPVISDAAIAKGAKLTFDIDQIGNGSAKGLKVWLIGRRTL